MDMLEDGEPRSQRTARGTDDPSGPGAGGADIVELDAERAARRLHEPERREEGREGGSVGTRAPSGASPLPPGTPPVAPPVTFHRRELDLLLRAYGHKVAAGEWRDYAIDFTRDRAVFSCFRRASEMPQFRIIKDPKLARRQGMWSVVAANGAVLRRGHDLAQVLRVFDRKPRRVI